MLRHVLLAEEVLSMLTWIVRSEHGRCRCHGRGMLGLTHCHVVICLTVVWAVEHVLRLRVHGRHHRLVKILSHVRVELSLSLWLSLWSERIRLSSSPSIKV